MADKGKPLYLISVVADMLKIHPQTLRLYERRGLIRPSRTVGRTRLYSAQDVEEIERVLRLTRDLGVNLAGVEIILKMRRRMVEMQQQTEDLLQYIRHEPGRSGDRRGTGEALVKAATGSLRRLDDF